MLDSAGFVEYFRFLVLRKFVEPTTQLQQLVTAELLSSQAIQALSKRERISSIIKRNWSGFKFCKRARECARFAECAGEFQARWKRAWVDSKSHSPFHLAWISANLTLPITTGGVISRGFSTIKTRYGNLFRFSFILENSDGKTPIAVSKGLEDTESTELVSCFLFGVQTVRTIPSPRLSDKIRRMAWMALILCWVGLFFLSAETMRWW